MALSVPSVWGIATNPSSGSGVGAGDGFDDAPGASVSLGEGDGVAAGALGPEGLAIPSPDGDPGGALHAPRDAAMRTTPMRNRARPAIPLR
jgi:hypothetical protein